eukprot:8787678-Alexandrium_andersonii.AAC.1
MVANRRPSGATCGRLWLRGKEGKEPARKALCSMRSWAASRSWPQCMGVMGEAGGGHAVGRAAAQ